MCAFSRQSQYREGGSILQNAWSNLQWINGIPKGELKQEIFNNWYNTSDWLTYLEEKQPHTAVNKNWIYLREPKLRKHKNSAYRSSLPDFLMFCKTVSSPFNFSNIREASAWQDGEQQRNFIQHANYSETQSDTFSFPKYLVSITLFEVKLLFQPCHAYRLTAFLHDFRKNCRPIVHLSSFRNLWDFTHLKNKIQNI